MAADGGWKNANENLKKDHSKMIHGGFVVKLGNSVFATSHIL